MSSGRQSSVWDGDWRMDSNADWRGCHSTNWALNKTAPAKAATANRQTMVQTREGGIFPKSEGWARRGA